jgi:hypothetical protein
VARIRSSAARKEREIMSMSRIVRHAVGLAVVLAISAQVAQAAAPDHLRWKGQDVNQVGPMRGPTAFTPIHRKELVLGGAVRQPAAVVRAVHTGGGSGFDWTAALTGAGSVVAFVLLAGGAATGLRSRRRVAIS